MLVTASKGMRVSFPQRAGEEFDGVADMPVIAVLLYWIFVFMVLEKRKTRRSAVIVQLCARQRYIV
ncbi:hypothetical protein PQR34_48375 [Paraburkholderia sediminicola]|uniref:hypothetical protein n=1 Tax=Paraburkholderia sediminicola TaxID=458836 RepID=UPI0038B8FC45